MEYRIPLFALNYDAAEETALTETLRSKWISMGSLTAEFEQTFAAMIGSPFAVAVTNCTAALHLALDVLGVRSGDEVITSSLTFVATVNAIRYVGATPVFCDIVGPHNLNMDPRHLANLITPRTRALMVMHYGGFPCDMAAIMAAARRHGLRVVEDACHGPLSECDGHRVGTIGDIGCFSFFSNKNVSTAEGGMMVMADSSLAERARLLRSHGMTTLSFDRARGHAVSYDVVALGYNYRIDDLRASLGLTQLRKLPADLARRAELRETYRNLLSGVEEVLVPFETHHGFVSNYIFPLVLRNGRAGQRDRLREEMHRRGVQTSVHYPAVHRFTIYQDARAELPQTDYATDNELTLPMYAALSDKEVGEVVDVLKAALCRCTGASSSSPIG